MDKSYLAEALVLAGARLDSLGLVPAMDGEFERADEPPIAF